MKKIIFALLICITTTLQGQIIEIETAKKAGLASYLTTVKTLAEFKMLTLMKDTQYVSKSNAIRVGEFNSKYNLLKLSLDQLINQIAADSYDKNRLQSYRVVNDLLKKGKVLPNRYEYYKDIITEIDAKIEILIVAKYGSLLGGSITDFTGIAEQTIGLITAASEMREKKIQSITALLKELKLKSIADLKPTEIKKD